MNKLTFKTVFAAIIFCALAGLCVLVFPAYFGLCSYAVASIWGFQKASCYLGIDHVEVVFYLTLSLALITLLLLFLRNEIFYSWLKFSAWAFPLFVFLSISMGWSGRGLFVPSESEWAVIFSWLFAIISCAIIGWKYWRLSKKGAKTKSV